MKVSKNWLEIRITELNVWLWNNENNRDYTQNKNARDYYVNKLIELEENQLETIKV